MKIIENNWNQSKEVVYKGNTLIVPVWTNWVAIQDEGQIVSFPEEPYIFYNDWDEGNWVPNDGFYEFMLVGKVAFEDDEDWKQSLVYVGE